MADRHDFAKKVTVVPAHPCEYSPEVIEALRPLITTGEHVHDPFAGMGNRLAALCDFLGATYSGTDIEEWAGRNPRVQTGDSTQADSYPVEPFTVVTSPVYLNKRLADYANGPLTSTKVKGRRDYGISLGRALHANNLARQTGRPSRADAYWQLHGEAVKHWGDRALVNVDSPIGDGWCSILEQQGYDIATVLQVRTHRYGGLDNAEKRADYEVLIVAFLLTWYWQFSTRRDGVLMDVIVLGLGIVAPIAGAAWCWWTSPTYQARRHTALTQARRARADRRYARTHPIPITGRLPR